MAIVRRKHRIEVQRLYPYPVSPQEQVIVFDIVSKEIDLTRTELFEELQHLVLAHIFEVVLDQRHKVGFSRLDREETPKSVPCLGSLSSDSVSMAHTFDARTRDASSVMAVRFTTA